MTTPVRIALTQTKNAYAGMPAHERDLRQLTSKLPEVRQANLEHHAKLIGAAAAQGAQLVMLGELFAGPYFALDDRTLWRDLAEDALTGPSVTAMRAQARQHNLSIVAPIYELTDSGQRFNTAVVIDDSGEILGCYRKTHIPQGTNDIGQFSERFYYDRSDGEAYRRKDALLGENRFFPVFRTPGVNLGVAICYDRHFEGVMRTLAQQGAQLVCCPAVTFGTKSKRMWRQEAAVDAARHNLFIALSNRSGREPPFEVDYFGDSHVVGPNGALDNISTHTNLVICDVPIAQLDQPDPAGWRLQADRRDDIYNP